jgi:hypothetical protein
LLFLNSSIVPKKNVLNIFNLPNLIMCIQDSYGMLILKVGIQLGSFRSVSPLIFKHLPFVGVSLVHSLAFQHVLDLSLAQFIVNLFDLPLA